MLGSNYYIAKILETLVISMVIAYITSPLSIRIAHKLGVIDRPKDARRVHKKPIPRFGGMAIFLGSMAAMSIPAGMNEKIKIAMIGGALMYLLGISDDIKNLKPAVKFIGQWGIATLVYVLGIRITFIGNYFGADVTGPHANVILSEGVAYIITVFWIVGITNAVNLMDGLDGLAAGCTAIMALSLAYVAYIHGMRLGSMPVCIALVAVAGGIPAVQLLSCKDVHGRRRGALSRLHDSRAFGDLTAEESDRRRRADTYAYSRSSYFRHIACDAETCAQA